MKLAIVADWLPTYGGAEHVVAACSSLWPDSPIFTTVAKKHALPQTLRTADIRTPRTLQAAFRLLGRHQVLLPWMPLAIEQIDVEGYDVVLSSSHAVAKGVIPPSGTVHVCYCHTPMRYAWEMEEEYLNDFGLRGFLRRRVKKELKHLRRWDMSTAKRVDVFIANSSETQERIARMYGRSSIVIPPPVDDVFFRTQLPAQRGGYFFAFGRLVPYKRFDLLIELASRLKLRLKIGGQGSELLRLKAMAGPTVEFLEYVRDEDVPELYANAEGLFFPQVEDAGIVPMEALASGTPVIAFGKGGILDTVTEGVTGIFAGAQTTEAFEDALRRCRETTWDHAAIRESARRFHIDAFKKRIAEEVTSAYETFHAVH